MDKDPTYSDNLTLLAASRAGDEGAVSALVECNAGLVRGIAQRFVGRGTDLEDLIQIGNMGLLKAIRTFDPDRKCAFSTYAVPLIFGEIRRFLRDDGAIKVSRSRKRLAAALAREKERMLQEEGEVRLSDLAARCGVSVGEATEALEAAAPVRSLSETVYGDEDSPTVDEYLSDTEENERTFDRIALSLAIEKLPSLRRKIIILRYFRDLSQQQTADMLGLTQVKISREEKKILAFLRAELS